MLLDSGGGNLQPQVVALGQEVGDGGGPRRAPAAHLRARTTVSSAKRLIGRRFSDPGPASGQVGWGIFKGESGDARLLQGKTYTAQETSAHVLTHMVRIAEEATGETVDPQSSPCRHTSTMLSAGDAGLRWRSRISGAAHHQRANGGLHGVRHDRSQSQRVVVYDLGGGTFDVSVLHIGDDLVEVMSTAATPSWVAMTSIKPSRSHSKCVRGRR